MKDPLNLAISQALAEASARRQDMSRALDWPRLVELLAAQADDARASPLAYDQLLAMALDAAAHPGALRPPLLEAVRAPIDLVAQMEVRREVLSRLDGPAAKALARAAPDWAVKRAGERTRHDRQLLADWLRAAAELNTGLWDHPALPAGPTLRAAMLLSRTALQRRADKAFRPRGKRSPGPLALYASGAAA